MNKQDSNSYINNLTKEYTKGILWYITYGKMLYNRGISYVAMGITILSLLTFLKVWQETFNAFGITNEIMFIGFPIVLIVTCAIVGYIDVKNNMWQREAVFSIKNVSPIASDSYNTVKRIEAEMTELKSDMKEVLNQLHTEED